MTSAEYWKIVFDKISGRGKGPSIPIDTSKSIDEIIKEPEIEESEACEVVSQNLKNEILKAIKKYAKMKPEDIKEERYQKFRNMGEFQIL